MPTFPDLRALFAFGCLTALAVGQDPSVATTPCDPNAIAWVLPGDFPKALERAQKEQRILVVKGISFGVDTAGATCATKGVW
ncbi:MAG: hypothetical protein JNK15_16725 [Planctomycetes bacterium]|nr:hypothetical protein [Planctomycetota bacterium]